MKKLFAVVLVLLIALAVVTPAFAATARRGPFSLVGTITAIDSATGTVSVSVLRGNVLVRPYLRQTVVIQTTTKTRYLYKASATAVPTPITFADLAVGKKVSVNGTLANNVWTATRITVGANLSCLP